MNLSIIPAAMAATETAPAAGHGAADGLSSILFLVGIVVIFYFLVFRPQNKRAKEHKELISKLAKGDEVITNGGIVGKITKLSEDFVVLTIAEGVEITLQKSAVSTALPKGTLKTLS